MISGKRRSTEETQNLKKAAHVSLLSVENNEGSSPKKKRIEVNGRWEKVRATMDSGAAGHVMLEGMSPRVKLERKTAPKKMVAANGEQIRDWGEKTNSIKDKRGGFTDA